MTATEAPARPHTDSPEPPPVTDEQIMASMVEGMNCAVARAHANIPLSIFEHRQTFIVFCTLTKEGLRIELSGKEGARNYLKASLTMDARYSPELEERMAHLHKAAMRRLEPSVASRIESTELHFLDCHSFDGVFLEVRVKKGH